MSNQRCSTISQQHKSYFLINPNTNVLPPAPVPPSPLPHTPVKANNKIEYSTPQQQTIKSSDNNNNNKSKTDKASRDLKSSMKRLFSLSQNTNNNLVKGTKSTNLNDVILLTENNNNKSLENLSTISTTSSNTSSIATTTSTASTSNVSTSLRSSKAAKQQNSKTPTTIIINNKNVDSTKKSSKLQQTTKNIITTPQSQTTATSQSPRALATNSLKKHLNLFRNPKKVLLLNSATNGQSQLPPPPPLPPSPMFNLPPPPPPPSATSPQQHQYDYELNEQKFIKDLQTQVDCLKKHQQLDSVTQMKIKELNSEIERLSRLYDFEVSKQSKYEEKIQLFKQMAEEKQIESAALKYEYRKMQELKDNLMAENSYLKTYIMQPQTPTTSTTASASPRSTKIIQNSPRLNTSGSSNSIMANRNSNATTQSPRNNQQIAFNVQGIYNFLELLIWLLF